MDVSIFAIFASVGLQQQDYPSIPFSYSSSVTPSITSLTPGRVTSGNILLTINGTFFTENEDDVTVLIGLEECNVVSGNSNNITCMLPNYPAGKQAVQVLIDGYGFSNFVEVFYELDLTNVQPSISGFGGGRLVTLTGYGFGNYTTVKVCGEECVKKNATNTMITCESPVYKNYSQVTTDETCDIVVAQGNENVTSMQKYIYRLNLTSTITKVSPRRGGTGGGVLLCITGNGFIPDISKVHVKIGNSICDVTSANQTYVTCITGPSKLTLQNIDVKVSLKDRGSAFPENATFSYVDVWSSNYTWGGTNPPLKGRS